jgi:hypothetical protein
VCGLSVHLASCSGVFILASYGESTPKIVCEFCQPKLKKEVCVFCFVLFFFFFFFESFFVKIAKLRSRTPIDVSLFTPDERGRIESGKSCCESCSERLTVFRGPQKCSNCGDTICFKCCFDFGDIPHLINLDAGRGSRLCAFLYLFFFL